MDHPAERNTSMDPLFASVAEPLLDLVEDQLSNNDVSSDEELQAFLILNGLTSAQAAQAIRYRSPYLRNIFLQGHTPIRRNKHAIRFDPHRKIFELMPA